MKTNKKESMEKKESVKSPGIAQRIDEPWLVDAPKEQKKIEKLRKSMDAAVVDKALKFLSSNKKEFEAILKVLVSLAAMTSSPYAQALPIKTTRHLLRLEESVHKISKSTKKTRESFEKKIAKLIKLG